ncbi:MAG TPA: type II CAAX endopeptidase family protein [Rhizomicrobium sp.]|jgi:membrane protease YdiL (CAAX protease family)|nr:type II CAAX endopeptidase family protein [Rhizomicrobium sp.]
MAGSDESGSGGWRKGEFVRWQDLFLPVPAFLVWLGLLALAAAVAIVVGERFAIPGKKIASLIGAANKDFASSQFAAASLEISLLFFSWRVARRVAGPSLVARYRPIGWNAFLMSLAGGCVLALMLFGVNWEFATHAIVKFHVSAGERLSLPQSAGQLPLGLLCVGVLAPFCEELYFRGVVLSWLRSKMIAPLAAPASAAFFALAHLRFVTHPDLDGWVYTGAIAVVGLVNAVLALRTRSLWGPFAVHAGYNATIIAMVALSATVKV